MKRHPSLQDLSREHHLILLHARELRWASKGHGDLLKACRELFDFWKQTGSRHFKKEEEKLFPYCERCQKWQRNDAVDLVFKQHEAIRSLIAKLENLVKDKKELVQVSSDLAERLDEHIRHEERVVFEQIQDVLSEDEIENLGKHLKQPEK